MNVRESYYRALEQGTLPAVILPIVLAGVEEEAEVDADLQVSGARVGREEQGEQEVMRLRFKVLQGECVSLTLIRLFLCLPDAAWAE